MDEEDRKKQEEEKKEKEKFEAMRKKAQEISVKQWNWMLQMARAVRYSFNLSLSNECELFFTNKYNKSK